MLKEVCCGERNFSLSWGNEAKRLLIYKSSRVTTTQPPDTECWITEGWNAWLLSHHDTDWTLFSVCTVLPHLVSCHGCWFYFIITFRCVSLIILVWSVYLRACLFSLTFSGIINVMCATSFHLCGLRLSGLIEDCLTFIFVSVPVLQHSSVTIATYWDRDIAVF